MSSNHIRHHVRPPHSSPLSLYPPHCMQGDEAGVVEAVTIITAAVDRYKDLCEGRCSGERAEQGVKGACVRAGAVVRGQSGGGGGGTGPV